MNPIYNPPHISHVLAMWIGLATILFSIVLSGAALRQATQWVADFTPSWGRAYWALFCSFALTWFFDYMILSATGMKPGSDPRQYDPRMFLWLLPVAFLAPTIAYKSVLRSSEVSEVGLGQALIINILQVVIIALTFVAIAIICIVLGFVAGVANFKPSKPNIGEPTPPPAMATPPVTRLFATYADATKEAVRRYPELGVRGSPMNRAYLERYNLYQKTKPNYFQNTSWPVQLADEVANNPHPTGVIH
jgi:hypothetical protein